MRKITNKQKITMVMLLMYMLVTASVPMDTHAVDSYDAQAESINIEDMNSNRGGQEVGNNSVSQNDDSGSYTAVSENNMKGNVGTTNETVSSNNVPYIVTLDAEDYVGIVFISQTQNQDGKVCVNDATDFKVMLSANSKDDPNTYKITSIKFVVDGEVVDEAKISKEGVFATKHTLSNKKITGDVVIQVTSEKVS